MSDRHGFGVGNDGLDLQAVFAAVVFVAAIAEGVGSAGVGTNDLGDDDLVSLGYQHFSDCLEDTLVDDCFYYFHVNYLIAGFPGELTKIAYPGLNLSPFPWLFAASGEAD